jgi:hypothetical protein
MYYYLLLGEIFIQKNLFEKSDFLVHLGDFSTVGFGWVVFWSSFWLVKLLFGWAGFGRPVGGRVVGGRIDGLPAQRQENPIETKKAG